MSQVKRVLGMSVLMDQVRSVLAAWNSHDVERLMDLHSHGTVFQNHTPASRFEGRDEVKAHLRGILQDWPDLQFNPRNLRIADDCAVLEWTASATHVTPLVRLGRLVDPTRQELSWDGVDIFTFDDGLITRTDAYIDVLGLWGKMGVI